MRVAAALAYLLLVGVLVWLVAGRAAPPSPALVAARNLPPNSLVLPGDLRPAGVPSPTVLDGRYLGPGAEISVGAAAPAERFAAAPNLWPEARQLLLALPLPERLEPRAVNAGGEARLCHPALNPPVALAVRALRCTGAGSCLAILELPPERAAQAAGALAALQEARICPP
ncbi:MAG TPA: hypothetical protein VIL69_02675 [Roseomonas sp.]|jgi:hypothetical protein